MTIIMWLTLNRKYLIKTLWKLLKSEFFNQKLALMKQNQRKIMKGKSKQDFFLLLSLQRLIEFFL